MGIVSRAFREKVVFTEILLCPSFTKATVSPHLNTYLELVLCLIKCILNVLRVVECQARQVMVENFKCSIYDLESINAHAVGISKQRFL